MTAKPVKLLNCIIHDSIFNSVLIVQLCDLSFHGDNAIEGYCIEIESFFHEIFENS